MTKKEAVQVLAILKAAYPNFYKNVSQEEAQGTISVWCMHFADMPAEIVLMALNKHISVVKYPPSIAEIKDKITSIHWEAYGKVFQAFGEEQLTEEEEQLYRRIYKATENYKYENRIEPTIKQMVGGTQVKQLTEGETK